MRRRTRHNPPASTTATIAGIAGAVAVVMAYRYFSQRANSAPPPPPPPPPPQGGLQNSLPANGFSLTVNPADAGTLTLGPSGDGFKQYLVGVAPLDPVATLAPVAISVEGLPVGLVAQVAYATGATGATPTMPATVKVMATEGVTPAPGPVRFTIVGTSLAGRATVPASLTVAAAPARTSGIHQTDTLPPMPALYGRNIVDMTGLRRGNRF
jgi:hypothetical protein